MSPVLATLSAAALAWLWLLLLSGRHGQWRFALLLSILPLGLLPWFFASGLMMVHVGGGTAALLVLVQAALTIEVIGGTAFALGWLRWRRLK